MTPLQAPGGVDPWAGANHAGAVLRGQVLDGVRAAHACFDGVRLEDSSARGADFSDARFRDAHLSETTFERALLCRAVFDGAQGEGTVFRGADLSAASFQGARLGDADFRGCDLRGANFSGGRFHHADFRGAMLDGALFEGADCGGALFDAQSGPPPTSQPASAGPDDVPAAWGAVEALMQALAARLDGRPATPSDLLAGLLQKAGLSGSVEHAPDQAAQLRELLAGLRGLRAPAGDPAEQVRRFQGLLERIAPQVKDQLGADDWQVLSDLIAQLPPQAERGGER